MPQRRRSHNVAADDPFDLFAGHLEKHLDIKQLLDICGLG